MHRRLLLLLFIVTGLIFLKFLINPLLYNLFMLSSGATMTGYSGNRSIWYGIGVHNVGIETRTDMLEWTLLQSSQDEECTDQERSSLDAFINLPFQAGINEQSKHKYTALRARQKICTGEPDVAATILPQTDNQWFAQQVALSRILGQNEKTVSLITPYLCPPDVEKCVWCIQQMYSNPMDINNKVHDQDVPENYTNKTDPNLYPIFLDILNPDQTFNVTLTHRVPLVVGNVRPSENGENYIEYSAVPVSGSTVRYRLQGTTLSNTESCVSPRLVAWSESGEYLGEAALQHEVINKFDIELVWSLPRNTTSVTPRITFSQDCFAQFQEIAICSADLNINP